MVEETLDLGKGLITNYTTGTHRLQIKTIYTGKSYQSMRFEYNLRTNGAFTFEEPINSGKMIEIVPAIRKRFYINELVINHRKAIELEKANA